MDRALEQCYQLALVLTLWITGLGLGMSLRPSQILGTLRRGGLFARAAVLDVVLVPLLVWGLVHGFSVPDSYAIGLLLVGMASAGPLGIKAAQLARADLPYTIALVVVLEAANVVAILVWVALLLPPGVQVPMGPVVRTLGVLVLAPLAGVAVWARNQVTNTDRLRRSCRTSQFQRVATHQRARSSCQQSASNQASQCLALLTVASMPTAC